MRTRSLVSLVVLFIVVALSTNASAQKFEFGAYGGGSFFSRPGFTFSPATPSQGLPGATEEFALQRVQYRFVDGGVFGVRARQNIWEHFGLEQSFMISGTQNAVFADPINGDIVVGNRFKQLYLNGVFTALSSESKMRPYVSAGGGWSWFKPTDAGQAALRGSSFSGAGNETDSEDIGHFNVGAGVKLRMARHLSLDLSVRDFIHRSPTFGFPGAIYDERDIDHNVQATIGLNFTFGGYGPLIVHNFMVAPTITASNASLCPGESSTLSIVASDTIPENQITYRWTADGQQVSTAPQYTYVAPNTAGPHDVGVNVFYASGSNLDKSTRKAIEKNPGVPADRKIAMTVKEYRPPTAVAAMDRTTLARNDKLRLTSMAQGSECSGMLTYRWSASDGRIAAAADSTAADFDSSNITFSETVQGQQCKPVKVTLEVTDQRGGTATDSKDVQVCYTAPPPPPPPVVAAPPPPPPPPPMALQLSDINFGLNSARVNNCAKRVLANDLYPQLTDARYRDYDVYLVGHRDADEVEKLGRQGTSTLDRDRVLNAASFLTGAGSSCKDIELTRVNVAWTATEQRNDFRSNLCDSSTVERRRDSVSSADPKAKNRRVEVWLVPKGATLPAQITAVEESRSDITKKGCPR